MVDFKIVIPARHASTRLPGKPLLDIAGRPMIYHVCERGLESGASEVVLATDDERIAEAVAGLPVRAVMTSPDHHSGTERIREAADIMGWADETIVVNLQGDEPFIPPDLKRRLARLLAKQDVAEVATLATPIIDRAEIFNPNAVKVVVDRDGHALYFSRAPIPWHRASFNVADGELPPNFPWLRHIGVYAYSVGFLHRYVSWPPSELESIESLEQLRILWMGERILVMPVDSAPEAGVDTEEDLHRVRARFGETAE
jgi:3-deoxy-manno-octulosonate cytidylyltransferase (CMP-KDO synthetase)